MELLAITLIAFTCQNFIQLIIGIIVWAFGYFFKHIILYVRAYRQTYLYPGLVNNYFIYIYSTSGDKSITTITLYISKKRWIYRVTGISNRFRFNGTFEIKDRNTYINLKGTTHYEQQKFVFNTPLHRIINRLWGTASCISVLSEPVAAVCLLSINELSQQKVIQLFDDNGFSHERALIKIPVNIKSYLDNEKS